MVGFGLCFSDADACGRTRLTLVSTDRAAKQGQSTACRACIVLLPCGVVAPGGVFLRESLSLSLDGALIWHWVRMGTASTGPGLLEYLFFAMIHTDGSPDTYGSTCHQGAATVLWTVDNGGRCMASVRKRRRDLSEHC